MARTHRSGVPLRREVASLDPVEYGFEAFGEAFFTTQAHQELPPERRDSGEFPVRSEIRRELLVNLSREERFAEGLETVLDGIEARYFSAERYP